MRKQTFDFKMRVLNRKIKGFNNNVENDIEQALYEWRFVFLIAWLIILMFNFI